MPDEKVAAPASEQPKQPDLGEQIARGLAAALPAAIKPLTDEIQAGRVVKQPERVVEDFRPAQIQDVTEDEIADAIDSGDKTRIAQVFRKRSLADRARGEQELQRLTRGAVGAFGSAAKVAAERLPHYNGKWKKLIDEEMERFRQNYPDVPPLFEHYKWAHDHIVGENYDEIKKLDDEAAIRQAREREEALIPNGDRAPKTEPVEPTELAQVLAGDWKREFRVKERAVGGRTEDEELRKMGFRGGFKDFMAKRKELDTFEDETNGSFGLDQDFDKNTKTWVNRIDGF